ncbi:uncharacterized protein BJ171DRAFT_565562 [Polychytrium aggregatum]|uniref:uncharacterized protein n=1 Tax=Polychytrium aggregatum TaxID=110093 RepID=UPI0022FE547C|nr:uncharacterized protein BJ171DRAFT_565562 [Polychytrium aggregatum]KAI9207790.1 hypothetical protein BJ171DRAFT_565562 [Polychytrium aggregatum]
MMAFSSSAGTNSQQSQINPERLSQISPPPPPPPQQRRPSPPFDSRPYAAGPSVSPDRRNRSRSPPRQRSPSSGYRRGYARSPSPGYRSSYGGGSGRGGYERSDRSSYDRYDDRSHGDRYGDRSGDRYGDRPRAASSRRTRADVIRGTDTDRKETTCLYVGNIPYDFVERDVVDIFEKFGRLKSVSVPVDRITNKNKGFAFVNFIDRRDAEDAKNKYTGFTISNRTLKLDWDVGREKKDDIRGYSKPSAHDAQHGASYSRRSPRYSPYSDNRRRSPSPPRR